MQKNLTKELKRYQHQKHPIEENEHNRSGLSDETREFQNHLFSLYYDQLTMNKIL